MKSYYKNILVINTGGGLGDAVQHLSLLNYINENINPEKIYYYATDGKKFWYNNKLKEYAPENLIVIKNFPDHFGFIKSQIISSKKLINNFNFESFDLIIDNQTRITNSLIYKMLPHKHYISPCYNYFLSRPFFLMNKPKGQKPDNLLRHWAIWEFDQTLFFGIYRLLLSK